MFRLVFIFLITFTSLFSASFFTLDNVGPLNIYVSLKVNYLNKAQKDEIQNILSSELKKAGFTFVGDDPTTFMLKIEAIEVNDTQIIYTQIALGENIKTLRKGNISGYAFTYVANDFIDSDEPYADTLESVRFLLSEFIEAHKDDNE
ncbi:hypothetical protein [Sulfurimonas sp.]|uniref:hypothetical protein n=1 Tax=Sulfurimonas sp. TaxID=2022749 RepID=UPI002B4A46B1|nr:hypothetical protein [Sulfurimonas sp.]